MDPKMKAIHVLASDSELADWVLIELLRRLPIKSLLKFKCVSKRWLSLISDPTMERAYIGRTDSPTYTLLCRHTALEEPNLDQTVKIETHPRLDIQLGFDPKKLKDLRLMAAHNGYLLTRDKESCYVSDTNPFSSQCDALPAPPRPHSRTCFGFMARSDSTYTVVLLKHVPRDRTLELDLFDSRSGQWRSSTLASTLPPGGYIDPLKPGVVYRGALHWPFRCVYGTTLVNIIVYDPAMHESQGDDYICRVIQTTGHQVHGVFGLSGGELRCADISRGRPSRSGRVWLLKDYDSAEFWCLEHEIGDSDMRNSFSIDDNGFHKYSVLGFNPIEKCTIYFLLRTSEYRVVSYDVLTQTVEVLCSHEALPERGERFQYFQENISVLPRGYVKAFVFPEISVLPFVVPPLGHGQYEI